MPTRAPSAASASARLTAVVDFPTPPLPEATGGHARQVLLRLLRDNVPRDGNLGRIHTREALDEPRKAILPLDPNALRWIRKAHSGCGTTAIDFNILDDRSVCEQRIAIGVMEGPESSLDLRSARDRLDSHESDPVGRRVADHR